MATNSGYTWEVDPAGDPLRGPGRTDRVDVRAAEDHEIRGILKRSPDPSSREIYSIGVEHVALTLGRALGLPIPEIWLDIVGGGPVGVVQRIPNSRNWSQAESGTPMMLSQIANDDMFPLAVAFDIWMANTDRSPSNLQVEPLPLGVRHAMATSSQIWLIDHGCVALWFPNQFHINLNMTLDTELVDIRDGLMRPEIERMSRYVMPSEYRQAFTSLGDDERTAVLDHIRNITDDAIERAVADVPNTYFTRIEAEKTVRLLKIRRDRIDALDTGYW